MDNQIRITAGMTPLGQPSRRCAFRLAVVLAGLLLRAQCVAGQDLPKPTPLPISSDALHRLAEGARDSTLAPWQRDFMLGVAGDSVGSGATPPWLSARNTVSRYDKIAADDGRWLPLPPPSGRDLHTAIYDPVRDRMLIFGGYDGVVPLDDVWALSLAGSPAWSALSGAGGGPSGRLGSSAVYDPLRDRMLVFGSGDQWGFHSDVWALSLGESPVWTELISGGPASGGPASGRVLQSAIYDPVRDRLVIFGGFDGRFRNDVWALSLSGSPTWSAITPTGNPPSARDGHAAIYDPDRNRMVVYGGNDGAAPLNDVWTLSLGGSPAWSELSLAGTRPAARYFNTGIFDPVRDRVVIFGGGESPFRNDVWALSLSGSPEWSELVPTGGLPSGRHSHTAIFDPVRDRMVIFGGYEGYFHNDTWALSLADPAWTELVPAAPEWSELVPTGTAPGGRFYHTAIYDPVRDRMVIFGGVDGGLRNDVWALSLAGDPAWSELVPAGTPPSPRYWHTAIYDPVRDRMLVFGGYGCYPEGCNPEECYAEGCNDVWALSLSGSPTWSELVPAGTPPRGLKLHTAIYDPVRDRMVVFGGYNLNNLWELSLTGSPSWRELVPTGSVPYRFGRSAIYDPVHDRMLVFGGYGCSPRTCSDLWALSLAGTPAWSEISPAGSRSPGRYQHTAIYDPVRERMVVFGGIRGQDFLNDAWILALPASSAWAELTFAGSPPEARVGHTAIYDPVRDRMVVFGGVERFNDVWALTWGTPNRPPDCGGAVASGPILSPPNHQYRQVSIHGVTDPDGDAVTITVTGITQDEPVNSRGDGATCPDARIVNGQASVRAERGESGNGRVYAIHFTAEDGRGGRSEGVVSVCVPHDQGHSVCLDDGQQYVSAESCGRGSRLFSEVASLEVGTVGSSDVAIHFELPAEGQVEVAVFDVVGRRRATIESGDLVAGEYDRVWRLDAVPKGLYFVRMRTAASAVTQRVLVSQ